MSTRNTTSEWHASSAELSEWSDYDGDDDADCENEWTHYFNWSDVLQDAAPPPVAASLGTGSVAGVAIDGSKSGSSSGNGSSSAGGDGGRPPTVPMSNDTLRWMVHEGYSNEEIARFFGSTISAVDSKKRRLGLTRLRKASLPTCDELSALWQADPRAEKIEAVAASYGVSCNTLRRHFADVGFSPGEPHGFEVILEA